MGERFLGLVAVLAFCLTILGFVMVHQGKFVVYESWDVSIYQSTLMQWTN